MRISDWSSDVCSSDLVGVCDQDRPDMGASSHRRDLPVPGRHITDHQMRLYMKFRQTDAPQVAAAKASFSTATAYRIEKAQGRQPVPKEVRGRRRPDPLIDIFDAEVVPLLESAPGLRAVAIFEEMQRRHSALDPGVRGTQNGREHV